MPAICIMDNNNPLHISRTPSQQPLDRYQKTLDIVFSKDKFSRTAEKLRPCYTCESEETAEECEEILNNTQNEQFIVGGEEAIVGEFPHMTAIGSTEGEKIFWICGASLISEKFILTAAHCVSRRTLTLPELIARVTDQKLNRNNEEIQPYDFGIKKIIVHPDYRSRLKYNDIALMELDKEAIFSIDLRPACLYQSSEVEETVGQAIGWGATSYAGQYSDKLLKGDLNFVSNFECNKSYNEEPDHLPYGIISSQVCAGDSSRQRDTCQGDSGGPLQVLKYRKEDYKVYYEIIGITSFGQFCASGSPSVYTRVSSYLDWIEGIVWPDSN
ncbi:CLUMA_CG018098, isoform A [Clunio marinus]|uniref:CLUMA_CG018098, isoform A n=1 Tax=Clunio marinus TaxID=568069 RepID=A0A1J1IYF2_9DIPT|nr:CLUMA_CG018098, isoform A [Clunio marinus]